MNRRPLADNRLSPWYLPDQDQGVPDIAHEAYVEVSNIFRAELSEDEGRWLDNINSIHDVQKAVNNAKTVYDQRSPSSKAKRWLTRLSENVMYYGAIMDTLSQHHPEYVSLAWGAMKFFFIAVLNHEELLSGLAKALSTIADILPRTDLRSILYPTARMKASIAALYACIMRLLLEAMKWYKKGKINRAMSSITKPWALAFDHLYRDIVRCSKTIDDLGQAAVQAEMRDMHVKLYELTDLATKHYALTSVVHHSIIDVPTSAVLDSIKLDVDPERDFRVRQSISTRYRARIPNQPRYPQELLATLREWSQSKASSLVIAYGSQKTSLQGFAVDIIGLIQDTDAPIIWEFCEDSNGKPISSLAVIFKSLLFQVLRLRVNQGGMCSTTMDPTPFRIAETLKQWADLLRSCVEGIPRIFIVIITDVRDQAWTTDLVKELLNFIDNVPNTCLKVLLIGRDSMESSQETDSAVQANFMVVRLDSKAPLTSRERSLANQFSRSQRGRRGRGQKPLSEGLRSALIKRQ